MMWPLMVPCQVSTSTLPVRYSPASSGCSTTNPVCRATITRSIRNVPRGCRCCASGGAVVSVTGDTIRPIYLLSICRPLYRRGSSLTHLSAGDDVDRRRFVGGGAFPRQTPRASTPAAGAERPDREDHLAGDDRNAEGKVDVQRMVVADRPLCRLGRKHCQGKAGGPNRSAADQAVQQRRNELQERPTDDGARV